MAIVKKPYGVKPDGQAVTLYTMTNSSGASVSVIDFGGIVTSIIVPDRDGSMADVALGCANLEGYLGDHGCMGDTVGRYGNRIAKGRFTLDGVTYTGVMHTACDWEQGVWTTCFTALDETGAAVWGIRAQ